MTESSDDDLNKKKKIKPNAEIPEHFTKSMGAGVQANSSYVANDQTYCSVCHQWFSTSSYYSSSHSCMSK
jgi:hypothetical protein